MISEIRRLMRERWEVIKRVEGIKQRFAVAAPYNSEIEKLHQEARAAFARLNGWVVVQSSSRWEHLIPRERRGQDKTPWGWGHFVGGVSNHDFACREPESPNRITAVVCQPYNDHVAEAGAAAERLGLAIHVPPDPRASIHYPGRTQFIVFTRPGVTVRWLPEQTTRLRVREGS
jgi:hypothetical protein